jgi:hypothetical protein
MKRVWHTLLNGGGEFLLNKEMDEKESSIVTRGEN